MPVQLEAQVGTRGLLDIQEKPDHVLSQQFLHCVSG